MFGRLGILKAFFDLRYFQLMLGLSGCNSVVNQGRPVVYFF